MRCFKKLLTGSRGSNMNMKYKYEKNFKISKKCPFCPQTKWSYVYKRWFGLLRHVECEHLFIGQKSKATFSSSYYKNKYLWKPGMPIFIRIYKVKYAEYYDYDISSPEECYELLYAYVTDNPSFRIPEKKKK